GYVIRGRPVLRAVLLTIVVLAGLERFEGNSRIPVIVVAYRVPVILPEVYRQIGAPIAGDALQGDGSTHLERVHLVRATPKWRLGRRRFEVPAFPIVLGQHRQLSHDLWQFAIAACVESEFHLPVADLLDLLDIGIVGAEERAALFLQNVE